MENTKLQRKAPEQLRLWPAAEEDALIYQASEAYRRLDETGQRIVRSYLLELDRSGDWPTQSRVAAAAGLSRSTVSAHLSDKASAAWKAITDVLVASRDDLARRSTVAIPALATLIMRQFLPAEGRLARATNTLTKVELEVLRLATAMGGCAVAPDGGPASLVVSTAQQSPDGAVTATQVEIKQGPSLAEMLSSLRGDAREQAATAFEPDAPKTVQAEETASSAQPLAALPMPSALPPSAASVEVASPKAEVILEPSEESASASSALSESEIGSSDSVSETAEDSKRTIG